MYVYIILYYIRFKFYLKPYLKIWVYNKTCYFYIPGIGMFVGFINTKISKQT